MRKDRREPAPSSGAANAAPPSPRGEGFALDRAAKGRPLREDRNLCVGGGVLDAPCRGGLWPPAGAHSAPLRNLPHRARRVQDPPCRGNGTILPRVLAKSRKYGGFSPGTGPYLQGKRRNFVPQKPFHHNKLCANPCNTATGAKLAKRTKNTLRNRKKYVAD